jgi:hypothetical protein
MNQLLIQINFKTFSERSQAYTKKYIIPLILLKAKLTYSSISHRYTVNRYTEENSVVMDVIHSLIAITLLITYSMHRCMHFTMCKVGVFKKLNILDA